MRERVLLLAIALGACREEIILELNPRDGCGGTCGSAPLGCIEHLSIRTKNDLKDQPAFECTDVSVASSATLCNDDLADAISVGSGDGSLIEVRGHGPGAGDACDGPVLFVGIGIDDGGDDSVVSLDTSCVLDCASLAQRTRLFRLDVANNPPGVDVTRYGAELGVLYDLIRVLDPASQGNVVYHPFAAAMDGPPNQDGELTISGSQYSVAISNSVCQYLRFDPGGGARLQGTCIDDQIEGIPLLDPNIDADMTALLQSSGIPPERGFFYGAVVDPSNGMAVQDAEVSAPGADVLYVDLDAQGRPTSTRQAGLTGPNGNFLVLGPRIGPLYISHASYETSGITLGILDGHWWSDIVPLGNPR